MNYSSRKLIICKSDSPKSQFFHITIKFIVMQTTWPRCKRAGWSLGLHNLHWRSYDWTPIRACDPRREINTCFTSSLIPLPLNIKQIATNNMQAGRQWQQPRPDTTGTMALFCSFFPSSLPQQIISTPLGLKRPVGLNSTKFFYIWTFLSEGCGKKNVSPFFFVSNLLSTESLIVL